MLANLTEMAVVTRPIFTEKAVVTISVLPDRDLSEGPGLLTE